MSGLPFVEHHYVAKQEFSFLASYFESCAVFCCIKPCFDFSQCQTFFQLRLYAVEHGLLFYLLNQGIFDFLVNWVKHQPDQTFQQIIIRLIKVLHRIARDNIFPDSAKPYGHILDILLEELNFTISNFLFILKSSPRHGLFINKKHYRVT